MSLIHQQNADTIKYTYYLSPFLLLVLALIASSSGRTFLYAQNIVTLYDCVGL